MEVLNMNITNLGALSNVELVSSLEKLKGQEAETTLAVLYHLIELDKRGYYRDLGFSSLFYYCTKKLGYSESSAGRRITAARCMREFPELSEMFIENQVTLCSIAAAAMSLREKSARPADLCGKSKREVEALVAKAAPALVKPRQEIKPLAVKAPEMPLFAAASEPSGAQLDQAPIEDRVILKFSVTNSVYEKYEKVKARLSNSLGANAMQLESVFEALIDNYLKVPRARTSKEFNTDSRHIPESVKRAVRERDQERCSFVGPNGSRCPETHFLHFDHILPFALGGKSTAQNVRQLCSKHNALMAERYFGKEKMVAWAEAHRDTVRSGERQPIHG
jgi:5-methylcytosine-specific restriction endonuclease McrA